jgi:hypothetical protein
LAANDLQTVWDAQVPTLNKSYTATIDLLMANKTSDAYAEFHANFVPAIKKVFSEAATSSPERFKSAEDWTAWVRSLYIATIRIDGVLAKGNATDAQLLLNRVHNDFYDLHRQTNTLKANDLAFALNAEVNQANPDLDKVKKLAGQLASAPCPAGSTLQPEQWQSAQTSFAGKINPALKSPNPDLGVLREAAKSMCDTVGKQLE